MKKLSLITLSLLGLTFLTTSCEDDEENAIKPTLSITEQTSSSTGGSATINQGTFLTFTWESREGDARLDEFDVSVTGVNAPTDIPTSERGNDFPYSISNADDNIYRDTLVFQGGALNTGKTNYTFTVTDKDGETKEVSFEITVEAATTPLGNAQSFTWERVGSNDGTGLSQFGLEWTSNTTQSAIVTTDANTRMVDLGSNAWTSLSTQEDLSAAIADGTGISQYTNVSVVGPGLDSYDDVLGVSHNGTDYLIHVTQGDVTGNTVLTFTITGEYKQ